MGIVIFYFLLQLYPCRDFCKYNPKDFLTKASPSIACENSRFSSLLAAGDVSHGGTSATRRKKFHTDDVKSVWNKVRSAHWSTEQLHCFTYCLRMIDNKSLTIQSIFVEYSLLQKKHLSFADFAGSRSQVNTTFTKIDQKKRKIDCVNIDLSHQYGISVAESQTFLRAKRLQQRRARKNGWFRMLHQTLCYTFNPPTVITFNLPCLQISSHMIQLSWWRLTISFCCSCCKGVVDFFYIMR